MTDEIREVEYVERMDFADYVQAEGINASLLSRYYLHTPAHAKAYMDGVLPSPSQEALDLGNAVHWMVLEPSEAMGRIVVPPKIDRRTTAGKAEYAAFVEKAKNRLVLSKDAFTTAVNMAETVNGHEIVREYLDQAQTELSAFGMCPMTDAKIKGRADAFLANESVGRLVIDLKTTTDASYRGWMSSMNKLGYWMQAGHYGRLFNADAFVFICVEKKAPYNVGIYRLAGEQLAVAKRMALEVLGRVTYSIANEFWPDTAGLAGVVDLTIPDYAITVDQGGLR
jgi:hypothetical protein